MSVARFSEEWLAKRIAHRAAARETIVLELAWPPTVNHMYEATQRGKRRLSEEAKAFRAHVAVVCMAAGGARLVQGRVRVTMHASPPDARKRDLDNIQKSCLDALQHSGVYADDCLIDDLRILRIAGKPGTVNVYIEAIGDKTNG